MVTRGREGGTYRNLLAHIETDRAAAADAPIARKQRRVAVLVERFVHHGLNFLFRVRPRRGKPGRQRGAELTRALDRQFKRERFLVARRRDERGRRRRRFRELLR